MNKFVSIISLARICGCLSLAAFCFCGCADSSATEKKNPFGGHDALFSIVIPDDTDDIQRAIESLPECGGIIQLKAGTRILSRGIHVDRSNVTISGVRGTCLKLAPNVNQPVFLIGSPVENPDQPIENIHIKNLAIDGSMKEQSFETDPTRPWIRNNGIDVRKVNDLWVDHVEIYNARSGGMVASWDCNRIFIDKSSFHHNFFDGIALYDSTDVQVSNFLSYENKAAGISLDNHLQRALFSNGIIHTNGSSGVFVRNSRNLTFSNLMILKNGHNDGPEGEDGCFLAHSEQTQNNNTGVERLFFNSCSFIENKRNGLYLASPANISSNNSVVACLFSGNGEEAIKLHTDGQLFQAANIFQ
jgi:hypothetical protein